MTLFGWDASDFDWPRGPMDYVAAKAAGISFATHKSTESNNVTHAHFGEALNRMKSAGIPFYGTYVVPRSGVSVQAQVDYAIAYWDSQIPWWRTDPNFFIQVDLEHWPYDQVSDSVGETMARLFEPVAPTAVLLYGSKGQYGGSIDAGFLKWNANYAPENAPTREFHDIYAHVGGDSGPGWEPYGADNTPAKVWQFASDATIGSQRGCDINAFRGSLPDFAAMIKGTVPGVVKPVPIEVWSGVDLGPIGQKLVEIMSYYPKQSEIYITSGRDSLDVHGFGSHHNEGHNTFNGSPTAAIDIGFGGVAGQPKGRDVAKWLYDSYWHQTVEEIHTTPYSDDNGFYVKNEVQYPGGGPYAGSTAEAHRDHVHFATSLAIANQILASLKAASQPTTEDGDMTPEQSVFFDSLVWRVEALTLDLPVVDGGISKGEINLAFRTKALVKTATSDAVWLINGATRQRRWISSQTEFNTLAKVWGRPIPTGPVQIVPSLEMFNYAVLGPVPTP